MSRSLLSREFLRFLIGGVVNTGTTYLLYLALLPLLQYQIAYTISYVAGIFLAYYINARFVFKVPIRLANAVQYPLVYLIQYGIGIGLLGLLVHILGISSALAPIVVTVVTLPVTFALSRLIVRR